MLSCQGQSECLIKLRWLSISNTRKESRRRNSNEERARQNTDSTFTMKWCGWGEERRGEEVPVEVFRVPTWEVALWPSSVHSLLIVYSVTYQILIENLLSTRQTARREWIRCCPYSHGIDRTIILVAINVLLKKSKWSRSWVSKWLF